MISIGIDIGCSSVKLSLVDGDCIIFEEFRMHRGRIRESLEFVLNEASKYCDLSDIRFGAVTGSLDSLLSGSSGVVKVKEVPALIEGCRYFNKDTASIIEIGGQNAKFISNLNCGDDSRIKVSMNSNCSSGTGSFIEEQLSRLNLNLEDYSELALKARSKPRIAGRCSVFAKTDITHHLQEGTPVEDILAGLAYAMSKSYRGAVVRRTEIPLPVVFAGGVALNEAMSSALKDELGIAERDFIVPENAPNSIAAGAALIALKNHHEISFSLLLEEISEMDEVAAFNSDSRQFPVLKGLGVDDQAGKHDSAVVSVKDGNEGGYLGIDIGSTSVNIVLINPDGELLNYQYLKSFGRPLEAVRTGFDMMIAEYGGRPVIAGAGITGSGRYMVGRILGVDVIKDEITSQAKAAVELVGDVDTIFEIGGQDSKYISLKNGVVADFQMNKICAAGTGSFVEEQALKFNIPIEDFGSLAIESERPADLGERCTVFIESNISAKLASGTPLEDIASGLCFSIVNNYLNRVVGGKKTGNRILLQGGVAHNQGIVNAFRAVTGKEVIVSPYFSVTGAYGAALLAREEMTGPSTFKGFEDGVFNTAFEYSEGKPRTITEKQEFNDRLNQLVFEGYEKNINKELKTIGIPRALFTYGMYPMFSTFFRELGYNVVLSGRSSEKIVALAQEYSSEETCYPVKLINGHIADLIDKKVDYIFFPDLYTVEHPDSSARKDHGCAYMQLAYKLVNEIMQLDKRGIELLSPTIAFNLGPEFMKESFSGLARKLGRTPEQTAAALNKGMQAYQAFEHRLEDNGRAVTSKLGAEEKAFVIISKTYGVVDPVLNMSIPDKLMDMGYKVLSFMDLPEADSAAEFPNMYWPFGQHILEAAQIVKAHPNLYAVYLSHHCCGPDTVLTHYVAEIMGDKPYLNIEIDEHSSQVGIITRLEAFVNSVGGVNTVKAESMEVYPEAVKHSPTNISEDLRAVGNSRSVLLPDLHPYSSILAAFMKSGGLEVDVLPPPDVQSLQLGRRHTMTNEYLSMTCLLGDILKAAERSEVAGSAVFLIPQNSGAEVDGQYSRLIRSILDREGLGALNICSPFIEDLVTVDEDLFDGICYSILAGDLVRLFPLDSRETELSYIVNMAGSKQIRIHQLEELVSRANFELSSRSFTNTVFVIGEPGIMYNDYPNNRLLRKLELQNTRLIYSPLSEMIWMELKAWTFENGNNDEACRMLNKLGGMISTLSDLLGENSPYEGSLDELYNEAGRITGLYAGGFGRYRAAKMFGSAGNADGILTLSSLYENTGIALDILSKKYEGEDNKAVLNLTFDGTENENDIKKLESFIHYLKSNTEVENAECSTRTS